MSEARADWLKRLGAGEAIAELCGQAGVERAEFDAWWRDECRRRAPAKSGAVQVAGLTGRVEIVRDARGVPHVLADNDVDLFFGFGFAVAQDRLFQLDHTRRKARGTLAELLGAEAIESDRLYRTLDLAGLAEREWQNLPDDVRPLLAAYADGVNALIAATSDRLPIECALLDYSPAPWTPQDSLAVVAEFRWYLTGRFPIICAPELVRRAVGDGPLYQAFLVAEDGDEAILTPDEWRATAKDTATGDAANCGDAANRSEAVNRGDAAGSGDAPGGSNNWVLSGERTVTGRPLVASDPHVPFLVQSIWHEVHLRGGSFNVAGVALTGMPGVMIGRNERVAWGVTNNISMLRDLYQQRLNPDGSDTYEFEGTWVPLTKRVERIQVRGGAAVEHVVRSTRTGPLVDQLLPGAARNTGPVSLRWVGFENCEWTTAVVRSNKATTAAEFRETLRPWRAPTFNVVFADVDGRIGYQCTGAIPLRSRRERGYRRGWSADDQWVGHVPWDELPSVFDPAKNFIATANNRVASDDYPQPLSGTWVSGYRGKRIRETIERVPRMSRDEHRQLQLDVHSGRAARCVPSLLAAVETPPAGAGREWSEAVEALRAWDFHARSDSTAAAVFNVFIAQWSRSVTAARLPADAVELVSAHASPLAVSLLESDPAGWLAGRDRSQMIRDAFAATLAEIAGRLGDDMSNWHWGRLHFLSQKHVLSGRGDLASLLDRSGLPLGGDGHTINSSSPDANHAAWLGAGYRMLADLADLRAGLWSVEVGSQSGHPGSEHYDDQLAPWYAGRLYYLPLVGDIDGERQTLE